MQKLLIADSSAEFISALERALADRFCIHSCFDGNTALDRLQSFQPDILIINLMLPRIDGLTVLQQTAFHTPIILAITPYLNGYVQHSLRDLGVDYTMIAPSVRALTLRLQHLIDSYTAQPGCDDPLEATVHHLRKLNLATHLDGYRQLCAAIPLYAKNPGQFMTKELYPAVAKQCGCRDGSCVEHSIRKAIHSAWEHCDTAVWRKYFTPGPRGRVPCPSNKEFICCLAELINTQ